ncbi:hypothetical protein J437_LFUL013635 [Ladona fulva]|uniref:PiggyBac transposable element-derived protein domain-containing protein n=1 Tax=Ladona fulva TaxID=123851 RepID=A0A8K0KJX2_LADFU|nr:hypothetical protein J437_LFUL013635 [Ladona fulva]
MECKWRNLRSLDAAAQLIREHEDTVESRDISSDEENFTESEQIGSRMMMTQQIQLQHPRMHVVQRGEEIEDEERERAVFDDKNTRAVRRANDKFAPIREIWDAFIEKCRTLYSPSQYCTIDEQLLSFRGRCPFKVYNGQKQDKYGIKIVNLNDSKTFYMVNAIPYVGKLVLDESTGFSLVFLSFGRGLQKPKDMYHKTQLGDLEQFTPDDYASKLLCNVEGTIRCSREALIAASKRQSQYYNLRRQDASFHEGALVWGKNKVLSKAAEDFSAKLAVIFVGPFLVDKASSLSVYHLKTPGGCPAWDWHAQKQEEMVR